MEAPALISEEVFAKRVIESRVARLLRELSTLKPKPQEETIHDTRVASRRLRAALEAFKDIFPARPWRSLYDRARGVTRTLGRIRETGVNLTLLKELSQSGDMAENLCREYLQEKFSKKRRKQNRRIKKKLRTLDPQRILNQANILLADLEARPPGSRARIGTSVSRSRPARSQGGTATQPALFELGRSALGRGQKLLADLAGPILHVRPRYDLPRLSDEQVHELRIEAKKLRYAMEIFSEIWPGGSEKEIALALAFQDATGHYHDWCVMRERVQREIRRLTTRETTHLAFQMGRLLVQVEERRIELRKKIAPPLSALQTALRELLPEVGPVAVEKVRKLRPRPARRAPRIA